MGELLNDEPITAAEALERLRELLATKTGQYVYSAGDYHPGALPWTKRAKDGLVGGDCRIAFLHGWKVRGSRPRFNRAAGAAATVVDDVNYNSLIEDGEHGRELVEMTYRYPFDGLVIQPGDFLSYPTFHLVGHPDPWVGHGAAIEIVPDNYDISQGWTPLTLLQCHGPDKFAPGLVRTDGKMFDDHDRAWPKREHRVVVFRPRERA